jgi:hypothetical protein
LRLLGNLALIVVIVLGFVQAFKWLIWIMRRWL